MRGAALLPLFALFTVALIYGSSISYADTAEELRQKIAERNAQIGELEKEIAAYQKEIDVIGKERQTLQGALKTLDLSRQKLATSIRSTENKISAKDLELSQLGLEINDKERRIDQNHGALGETLREIDQTDTQTLLEKVLGSEDLTAVWNHVGALGTFQSAVREDVAELTELKIDLEDRKVATKRARRELAALRAQLAEEKQGLDIARNEKSKLLTQTKNKEAEYQKILEEKQQLHDQFEAELNAIESELQITIDPSRLPRTGAGVLSWPLDAVRITQYFGNTSFATQNPQLYGGRGHNGIDLAASVGTRVRASLGGSVVGVGDTDTVCRNASYGKWVLLRHQNGLSTLYAHLSYIRVATGEMLNTGDVVGYSGNTGYSTGPHLHFTVYATQGVEIKQFPSKSIYCRGKIYTIPVADFRAYLNPLSYL